MKISIGVAGMVMLLASSAFAGGTFNAKQTTYEYSSGSTSLKVVEPDGFKVVVALADGSQKADTVPAVFALPEADAFLKVTITAPDGTAWTNKVEIRAKKVAVLAVGYKDEAQTQEKPARARSYVGKFYNKASGCGRDYARSIKADFIAGDGAIAKTVQLDDNTYTDAELASGKYDVRVSWWTGNMWDFVLTRPTEVTKDGWTLAFGCKRGTHTVTLEQ